MTKALMTTRKNKNNNICRNINTHSNGYKDENNDGDVRDNTKRNSNTTATYINDSDKRSDDDKRKEINNSNNYYVGDGIGSNNCVCGDDDVNGDGILVMLVIMCY